MTTAISSKTIDELDFAKLFDEVPINEIKSYMISTSPEIFDKGVKKVNAFMIPSETTMFDAVKGKDLHKYVENKENLTLKAQHDVKDVYRVSHTDLTGYNAVGCYLSHVSLWYKIVTGKIKGAYIFESDSLCISDTMTMKKMESYLENFNSIDGDLLLLGSMTYNPHELFPTISRRKNGISKITGPFFQTHAYYITYEGALKCLKYAFPIEMQVDGYLSNLVLLDKLDVYAIHPSICTQDVHISTIQTNDMKFSSDSKIAIAILGILFLIVMCVCIFFAVLLIRKKKEV
jgi:GR25 family glycosyltransferase involved in LPS biosynthesis